MCIKKLFSYVIKEKQEEGVIKYLLQSNNNNTRLNIDPQEGALYLGNVQETLCWFQQKLPTITLRKF